MKNLQQTGCKERMERWCEMTQKEGDTHIWSTGHQIVKMPTEVGNASFSACNKPQTHPFHPHVRCTLQRFIKDPVERPAGLIDAMNWHDIERQFS